MSNFKKILPRFFMVLLMSVYLFENHSKATTVDDQDHQLLSRMPGFVVTKKFTRDFDGIKVEQGAIVGKIKDATFPLFFEGRTTYIEYTTKSEATSGLAVYRNYREAIRSIGGRQLNSDFGRDSDGVEGGHLFEIPAKSGQARVVLLNIPYFQRYSLTIIEPAAMSQDVKGGSIAFELENKGVATLYINFDENKSDLKADGVEAVSQIAAVMAGDPALKVSIKGHTDNVGTADANKKLSTDRAQSVMKAVVAKGIAATRLSAKGFGAEVAAADNKTEEGRAKNRRVELVKVK